jgi:hypothetical protein
MYYDTMHTAWVQTSIFEMLKFGKSTYILLVNAIQTQNEPCLHLYIL